ncbi:MAG: T9SS type A sorting domain-containing protein [Candidatus Cloacimonetes bacterium]|nr:T9SS type A sorting domain-containing protein [Candidatus Cloacimonadota bacterium]
MRVKIIILLFVIISVYQWLNCITWIIDQSGGGNFTFIQEGIDSSADSDTILVYPGTYFENIIYNGKNITVASLELTTGNVAYIDSTIIDGQRITSCVCLVNEETDTCLRGFTITNGQGEFDYPKRGGGISIWGDPDLLIQCAIINCIITGNYSNNSGGMHIKDGNVFLSGTSVRNNYALKTGGGMGIRGYTQVTFDPVNRCSIYNNFAATGIEICTSSPYIEEIEVIVDTFTVAEPDIYFAQMYHYQNIYPYTFDILNYIIEPFNHDLYVSPDGDDSNSGMSPEEPMKTINLAVRKIASDSLSPNTIHLAAGTYNISENQQQFAFGCKAYVNIIGEDVNTTIIDAEMNFCPMFYTGPGYENSTIKNITFKNGNFNSALLLISRCDSISFENIVIKDCITEKTAALAGAGLSGNIHLKNVSVENTQSGNYTAGAIFYECSFFKAENCNFSYNVLGGDSPFCAGLKVSSSSDIIIEACTFNSNISTNILDPGSATAFCNTSYNYTLDNVYINNCLFSNNISNNIMNNGDHTLGASVTGDYILTFTNCTIIDNVSDYTCNLNGNIIFKNNILRNDCDYEIKLTDWTTLVSELSVSHCNIQGGQNAIYNQNGANIVNWLEGNIDEDPLFFGTPEQPYLLSPLSPCIDTGTPDTTGLYLPPWDLLHNYRVWDGDGNGVAIIDMGCYEFGAEQYVEATQYQIPNTQYQLTNYPNPFNPETKIVFNLIESGNVKLLIYNIKGQKVKTLMDCYTSPGDFELIWDGRDDNRKQVSSGVYFYQLVTNKEIITNKMILIK